MRLAKSAKVALILLLATQSVLPAALAVSSADIISAINKRQFLPSGSALNVRIDKDQVYVSTFRHANAEEKDCKIDAVLITRAVFEVAPENVARVTCYFYGKDMASYQEVSVSMGDIKAFASGQMTNEQLLSSLQVRTGQAQGTDTEKVSRQLESNSIARPTEYRIVQDKPDSLMVSTNFDPWVSDEEARLEALRMAISTFVAQPSTKTVKVFLTDPAQVADTREFDFLTERLDPMWKAIQNAVGSVSVVKRPVELNSLRVGKGDQQEAREALLAQLREMDKKGIGIGPFVKAFIQIETAVKREIDPKYVTEMVTRLKTSMDDQMKAFASAKERKVSKTPTTPEPPKTDTTNTSQSQSRWATGERVSEAEVLASPDTVVSQIEAKLSRGPKKVDENPTFAAVLEQVSAILVKNNRAGEAGKYQQRAAAIRAALAKKK